MGLLYAPDKSAPPSRPLDEVKRWLCQRRQQISPIFPNWRITGAEIKERLVIFIVVVLSRLMTATVQQVAGQAHLSPAAAMWCMSQRVSRRRKTFSIRACIVEKKPSAGIYGQTN